MATRQMVVVLILASMLGLASAAGTWTLLTMWVHHTEQHLIYDERVVPAVGALWQECKQRGKCQ